jgi:acetylornithine deacetylase/succinyl-diaminopimelate desuccinylase-like protein
MTSGGDDGSTILARAFARIDRDFDDHLETIRTFLRQPSVSSTGEGVERCAGMVAELIEGCGGHAEVIATDGHPAVIASIDGAGRRLLRYGMYDVQPADEPDWDVAPFSAEVRDFPGIGDVVVARGAANSKGTLAATLLAMKSIAAVDDLPCSVTFLLDGEEELGSPHLPGVVDARRDDLVADAAYDLDLMADRAGTPEIFLGCKGILSLRLSCEGGDWGGPVGSALHSSNGVLIASPAWSVVRALSTLVDHQEGVTIPHLDKPPIPDEDRPLLDDLATRFDAGAYLIESNARRYKYDLSTREMAEALAYEPVVNINALFAGREPGDKTIVPDRASAVIDIRIPYGTDIEAVERSARALVAEVAPEVTVTPSEICPPARTPSDSPVARAMIRSHVDAGRPARVWPVAPWWAPYFLFERVLGLPFAIGGAGHCGGAHAANEYASIEGLRQHMHQSAALLYRFAEEMETRS